MKQPLKIGLRVWIAITSILSFLFGWLLFSHSGKPAPIIPVQAGVSQPSQSVYQAATLPPVPSIDDLTSGSSSSNLQPLPSLPQTTSPNFFPRFRSRGS
jgi:hypothetical protein